jgi:hypothetical protein
MWGATRARAFCSRRMQSLTGMAEARNRVPREHPLRKPFTEVSIGTAMVAGLNRGRTQLVVACARLVIDSQSEHPMPFRVRTCVHAHVVSLRHRRQKYLDPFTKLFLRVLSSSFTQNVSR